MTEVRTESDSLGVVEVSGGVWAVTPLLPQRLSW